MRWIHKNEDGQYRVVKPEDDLYYELTWYRKELGARSDNAYSGVDWEPLSRQTIDYTTEYDDDKKYKIIDSDWIDYNKIAAESTTGLPRYPNYNYTWLMPDINLQEEQIKAILIYEG